MRLRLLSIVAILSLWHATAATSYSIRAAKSPVDSLALRESKGRRTSISMMANWSRGQSGRQNSSNAGKNTESPLDLDQIKDLVGILSDAALAETINNRGINFKIDANLLASLQRDGIGPRTLQVLRNFMSNNAPIVSLRISTEEIARGQDMTLIAEATDADGDKLLYQWETTEGSIQGEGSHVELNTTDIKVNVKPIKVIVSVTVGDRKGGFASASSIVIVRNPEDRPTATAIDSGPSQSGLKQGLSSSGVLEGKDIIVSLTGSSTDGGTAQSGSIEVLLSVRNNVVEIQSLTGNLPGLPCRTDLTGLENVAAKSLKEGPSSINDWSRIKVRIRPKDSKRLIRFVVGWQLLNEAR